MIVRVWRGRTTSANADAYLHHVATRMAPSLTEIPGFLGISVSAFAGSQPDQAVVEPEARAVLADYDDFVTHYQEAFSLASGRSAGPTV